MNARRRLPTGIRGGKSEEGIVKGENSLHIREQDHGPGSAAAEISLKWNRLRPRLRLRKTLNLNLHLFGLLIPTLGKKGEE
jgi:hypothetical protein